ncbi:MAG: XkdX family protein [Firmicutes bacterium]|nr:XkdX family protein [Candidatus Colivicinus equi]
MLPEGNDINSPSYANKIKKYYELGLWSKAMVKQAVNKGLINANEYELITGEPYVETTEQSL